MYSFFGITMQSRGIRSLSCSCAYPLFRSKSHLYYSPVHVFSICVICMYTFFRDVGKMRRVIFENLSKLSGVLTYIIYN